MERLTFEGNFCDIAQCDVIPGGSFCESGSCTQRKVWERLKAYEDTGLTPEDVAAMRHTLDEYHKVADPLLRAQADGRLVVPPCKVGDTLFRVFAGEILEHKVRNMRYLAIQGRWDIDTTPFCSYVESSIGKTIFLTRKEAKKALEAMKNE